jgi:glycosyltransferase involved in cell wall biosynthesis
MTEPATVVDAASFPHREAPAANILVVVPAYNEAQSIAAVLREVRAVLPRLDVLVVDDGSEDATAEVCAREGVKCMSLPFNLGVGGAMRAGFRYAQQRGYHVVAQVDADGQHDASFLGALVAEVERGADVVIGSRFAGAGTYRVSRSRRLAIALVSGLLSRACRVRLTDATSGFRVFSAQALDLFVTTYPAEYLGDTLQSLIMADRAGLTIRELPVVMRQRSGGRPSQGVVTSFRYLVRSVFLISIGCQTRPERDWRRGRSASA